MPQLFFVSKNYVLQPGDKNKNYVVSALNKSRQKGTNSGGPGEWHTFCYNSRILISQVSDEDLSWKVTALAAQDSRTINVADQIGNNGQRLEISFFAFIIVLYLGF